jgi:hypothetical protein
MSEAEALPIRVPSDGMKGLAMMLPIVGLPFAFHALSLAVLTGAGFFTISSLLSPFNDKVLWLARNSGIRPAGATRTGDTAAISPETEKNQ